MKQVNKKKQTGWSALPQNILAGLTVSFVALTLGAAFGVLSGRGAFAGMISAALIALITSALGGTRIQCSGPTGPMTTITAVVVAMSHDALLKQFPTLPSEHFINLVIILGGVIMLLMAFLRLGKYVVYIPNVVISGFMNGIAIIIWLDQIKRVFGLAGKSALSGPLALNLGVTFFSALLVFVLPSFLKKYLPKYSRLLSATLLTVVIMTALVNLLRLPIEHVELSASINSWNDVVNLVKTNVPTHWEMPILLAALPFALQLAILGYLDTLMTSLVIDKMTRTKTKQNQELFAQGVANMTAGLVGGIPGAQATIRSVLMVKEKATMRLAGILVGVFALLGILLFQNMINLIPQAVFAGILIKVGWDVFDYMPLKLYVKEWARDRSQMMHNFCSSHADEPIFVTNREFVVIFGTTLVTIFFDLNIAVGLFTLLFYFHNKFLCKHNPMRDLKPVTETESFSQEL